MKKQYQIEKDGQEKADTLQPKRNLSKITTTQLPPGAKRLRVQFDITYLGHPGKEPQGDSLTEPDMSLSISQLLEHHSRGKTVPQREPQYFNMEIPTFSDITDVERYKEQLNQRLKDTTAFLKEEKLQKAESDKISKKQKQATAYAEAKQLAEEQAKENAKPETQLPEETQLKIQ